jgi:hypothetical protein
MRKKDAASLQKQGKRKRREFERDGSVKNSQKETNSLF